MRYPVIALLCALLAAPAVAAEVKDYFADVNMTMHQDMMVEPTGDVDVDFVRGMIPHHQGAVDMAKIVLKHGKDPELRKLANDIVASQEKEITFMKEWLKKHSPESVRDRSTRAPDAAAHHHAGH